MKHNKPIIYLNTFLSIIATVFAVNTFSLPGHTLIQRALAAVDSITGGTGGTINYIARFAGAANPSYVIGDSIIYDDGAGHVGIGTTAPGTKLEIDSSSSVAIGAASFFNAAESGLFIANNDPTLNAGAKILFRSGATSQGAIALLNSGVNTGSMIFATRGAPDLLNNERMRITSDGNVGIGMTSPGAPLSFAKTVGEKIRLYDSNYGLGISAGTLDVWADHVVAFHDDAYAGTVTSQIGVENGYETYFNSRKLVIGADGNVAVSGGLLLVPRGSNPPNLTNGMMWMVQ